MEFVKTSWRTPPNNLSLLSYECNKDSRWYFIGITRSNRQPSGRGLPKSFWGMHISLESLCMFQRWRFQRGWWPNLNDYNRLIVNKNFLIKYRYIDVDLICLSVIFVSTLYNTQYLKCIKQRIGLTLLCWPIMY